MSKASYLLLLLMLSKPAFAGFISVDWESQLDPFRSNGFFSGSFSGFDANSDEYLTFDELTSFSLSFSGDEDLPAFSHGLTNLFPESFLFTLVQHCWIDAEGIYRCDPFTTTPTAPSAGLLSVATCDDYGPGVNHWSLCSGNYANWSYGGDAWEFGNPDLRKGSFSMGGTLEVTVHLPATVSLMVLSLLILARSQQQGVTI